jgi:indole-3-glycerol phosphate synthase
MNILDQIIRSKRDEVAAAKRLVSEAECARQAKARPDGPRGFKRALTDAAVKPAVIAEFKRKSPSKGFLRQGADAAEVTRGYEKAGASCLSVLTDGPFFDGSLADLAKVREVVRIPILRKDFLIDPYQVTQSYAAGADAVLLIAEALDAKLMKDLYDAARAWGLDVLAELHGEAEFAKLKGMPDAMVGINNRDLKTFDVSLETTRRLAALAPQGSVIVSESGIKSRRDFETVRGYGADAVLVGEGLMTQSDPGDALRGLLTSC